jgi:para-nitrobenzyl esterase
MQVSIRTPQGTVRGHVREDHQAFLGIAYAQPPVGPLRFAAPEPAATWQGTRDALAFGAVPPQSDRGAVTARGVQSEDCLFLNVFTPAADAKRRPVMVWLHGGAFSWGAGSEPSYDGGALAARGDVVVVTINYRLGALGYLYLGKHGGANWGASANVGQLDQIEALRWVRANIAAYGGDPEQVTIFGESAGAVAACALLATPAAQGLFVRAISQSGTANRLPSPAIASASSERFFEGLGLAGVARQDLGSTLRALDVDALLQAHLKVYTLGDMMFWPTVDGQVLPERPLAAVRAGQARNIPLLIGVNRDEMKFYAPAKRSPLADAALQAGVARWLPAEHKTRAAEVCEAFKLSRTEHGLPHENTDLLDAFETCVRFTVQASRLAQAHAEHQPDTFHYLFDWESPTARLGACHALEIPFVFGTLQAEGNDRFAGAGIEARRLSQQMMDSWVAFAKTGNPGCESAGEWPRYEATRRQTMVFGKRTHATQAPFEAERALIDRLLT